MVEPIPRERRVEDPAYLAWIRQQPCCICKTVPVEAAHLRVGSIVNGKPIGAMSMKSSDRWALPLCNYHHKMQHGMNELEFWAKYHIDPFLLSIKYQRSRP